MPTPLAQRVIDAYGGEERWRAATAVECRVSAHGWAFRMKLRRAMKQVSIRAELSRPHLQMIGWPSAGKCAIIDGQSEVRIDSAGGTRLASRSEPRRYFPGGRRRVRWDDLDFLYFAGYACWNYVTFPALLLRDDITWREVSDATLEAAFPAAIPTHSSTQRFHFDLQTGLLIQHDYTAEVFGDWAHAANVVLEHKTSGAIPFPSKRRVTPRKANGTPRPFPLLVGIEITDWRLIAT